MTKGEAVMAVLDKDEIEDLRLLCKAGWAIREIAQYFGIRSETAMREIEAHSINYAGPRIATATGRRKATDHEAQIVELWDLGLSISSICERVGFSRTVVGHMLHKAGRDLSVMRQRYDGLESAALMGAHRVTTGIRNED